MSTATERHEFQTEVRELLDLMIHSLYSHKDIFLRELDRFRREVEGLAEYRLPLFLLGQSMGGLIALRYVEEYESRFRGAIICSPWLATSMPVPRWKILLANALDRVLPAEAGLDAHAIDFSKGCYVGQEPVARQHYRGRVNRSLRVLSLAGPDLPEYDAELTHAGKPVGRVTSAARDGDAVVALGYVRAEVPRDAVLELEGRPVSQLDARAV